MDITTTVGLVVGLVIVALVMIIDGGSPAELFVAPQAILLTIGGALAAAIISYPMSKVVQIPKWLMIAFVIKKRDPQGAIELLAKMADRARREGLLSLEEESKKIDDAFLKKGVMMIVDGVDPAQVRTILEIETHNMEERHETGGIGFFNAAGGYGPTMGIIGTVMGLITVLQKLDNPGELGHSIAVAFLATLWGILSANLIWLPIAGKLRSKSEEEVAFRKLLLEGIISLQSGENPRLVREKLNAFLAPNERPKEEGTAKGKESASKEKAKAQA